MKKIGGLIVIIAIAFAAYMFYENRKADREKREAELELGLEASRMINVQFQRRADLIVSTISGDVVAKADCKGLVFHPTQRTKAPASVAYTVNLQDVRAAAYRWNPASKNLTIDIPDVIVDKPNVDLASAIVRQNGVFISRTCGLVLARQTAVRLSARAATEAKKPENITKAREAARMAIAALASGTLKGAGLTNVTVAIAFPWEPKSLAPNGERWDETRPLVEVLTGSAG